MRQQEAQIQHRASYMKQFVRNEQIGDLAGIWRVMRDVEGWKVVPPGIGTYGALLFHRRQVEEVTWEMTDAAMVWEEGLPRQPRAWVFAKWRR